jgi:hypothetical protein
VIDARDSSRISGKSLAPPQTRRGRDHNVSGQIENEMIVSRQTSDRNRNIKIPIKPGKQNTYPDFRTSEQQCSVSAVRPINAAVGGRRFFLPGYYY